MTKGNIGTILNKLSELEQFLVSDPGEAWMIALELHDGGNGDDRMVKALVKATRMVTEIRQLVCEPEQGEIK